MDKDDMLRLIPHPHWDVIARVIPGAVFLALVWTCLLDEKYAVPIWLEVKQAWYNWIAYALLSYLSGAICDGLSWVLTAEAARFWRWASFRDKIPSWSELDRWFASRGRSTPEGTGTDKAQVESRSLINLAILLLTFIALAAVIPWLHNAPLGSAVYRELSKSPSRWAEFLWAVAILALVSLLGGICRQRRRVWGMVALHEAAEGEAKKPGNK